MMDIGDFMKSGARRSLERVQNFEPNSIVLAKHGQYSFEDAVEPVQRLVSLFAQLPSSLLENFPQQQQNTIQSLADSVYSILKEILDFDLEAGDNTTRKANLIGRLEGNYEQTFSQLHPLIAYSIARTTDFSRLEMEQRVEIQQMQREAKLAVERQKSAQAELENLLQEVRKVANEQGITEEAVHFKRQADEQELSARTWRNATIAMAIVVGIFGLSTLFIPKWEWLAPESNIELVQYTVAKLLIFSVLVFMLIFCSRNYMATRRNEAVNRHRQNALLTYKVLVGAGSTPEMRDIVLNHAASAIYRLHETGYTRGSEGGGSGASIVEFLPKTSMPVNLS